MNILLIEDDLNKIDLLNKFLNDTFKSIKITIKYSYNSGLKDIIKNKYDILLLDMSMPVFDKIPYNSSSDFLKFGGEDILRQMKRRNIKLKTIVVTQYDDFGEMTLKELTSNLQNEFKDIFCGSVYYNAAETTWKNELKNLILRVKE